MKIAVIIPALNEEKGLKKVIQHLPIHLFYMVVVSDNGSVDDTAKVAKLAGAKVVYEGKKGYGKACLKAINYLKNLSEDEKPEIVLFIDADFSDKPEEAPALLQPILNQEADLVIGSRALGQREKGSMTPVQRFGNGLTATLMKILYKANMTDLGPFRAIRFDKLLELDMEDQNFGWTVEMQIKAVIKNYRIVEVPVSYRKRHSGKSKVSGTIAGSIKAGAKILYLTFTYALRR